VNDLAHDVADALIEIGRVRASIDSIQRDPRRSAAEHRIVSRHEALILDVWRAHRARPGPLTRGLVRRALFRWREIWLYGPPVD
jgi:hypothetical protein